MKTQKEFTASIKDRQAKIEIARKYLRDLMDEQKQERAERKEAASISRIVRADVKALKIMKKKEKYDARVQKAELALKIAREKSEKLSRRA